MANTKLSKPLLVIAVLGLLAGLYGVVEALVYRTEATGLGSYVPWGLGVALYLLFLGLSAGGLVVSILLYLFGMKELDRVSGLATFATLLAEVCAGIAIALDLGHWERMYRFAFTPSFSSPMVWMFVFFNAVMVIYLLKAWAVHTGNKAASKFWSVAPYSGEPAFLWHQRVFFFHSHQPSGLERRIHRGLVHSGRHAFGHGAGYDFGLVLPGRSRGHRDSGQNNPAAAGLLSGF